ncbi:MAG: bifunctional 3,4-dihydroxy-2-butanone-4-phosphate synthase/GTP cyclohydrolase II [Sporolactobacillus sp.]|nr:bifunctional 3,4-dihydroxy-2-butanone-4-phosphate synthase/GTP cyclohydrolase II [Sporolactobacillus sp.]
MQETIEEAVQDLKRGKLILICDDKDRENEGDLVVLAEHATPAAVNFMVTHGKGLLCVPVDTGLARKLGLAPMVANNTDNHETAFTVSIDHRSTTTGISAFERSQTIRAMVSETAGATDFHRPGHVFPLIARQGGVLERRGHTEAAVDLAKLAGAVPAAAICEVLDDDGHMARRPALEKIAERFRLKTITIDDLAAYRRQAQVRRVTEVDLPTEYGRFHAVGYRGILDGKEHIALIRGRLGGNEPTLVRIHSECLTGDVFGSKRCDCGPQLHAALRRIAEQGRGVLIYLRQEGRGIGLLNKLRAYKLQEQGEDTVEANQALGFPADMRDYGAAAGILTDLGITNVQLLTNNPLKIKGLKQHGIARIERIPLEVPANAQNKSYLLTKKEKMGHLLHVQKN